MRVHKLSITTPDLLTWEESEREGVSEPISVRTVMSIINCRGYSSDRHGHCRYSIHIYYIVQLNNNNARVILHANDNQGIKYIVLHTAHNDMFKHVIKN